MRGGGAAEGEYYPITQGDYDDITVSIKYFSNNNEIRAESGFLLHGYRLQMTGRILKDFDTDPSGELVITYNEQLTFNIKKANVNHMSYCYKNKNEEDASCYGDYGILMLDNESTNKVAVTNVQLGFASEQLVLTSPIQTKDTDPSNARLPFLNNVTMTEDGQREMAYVGFKGDTFEEIYQAHSELGCVFNVNRPYQTLPNAAATGSPFSATKCDSCNVGGKAGSSFYYPNTVYGYRSSDPNGRLNQAYNTECLGHFDDRITIKDAHTNLRAPSKEYQTLHLWTFASALPTLVEKWSVSPLEKPSNDGSYFQPAHNLYRLISLMERIAPKQKLALEIEGGKHYLAEKVTYPARVASSIILAPSVVATFSFIKGAPLMATPKKPFNVLQKKKTSRICTYNCYSAVVTNGIAIVIYALQAIEHASHYQDLINDIEANIPLPRLLVNDRALAVAMLTGAVVDIVSLIVMLEAGEFEKCYAYCQANDLFVDNAYYLAVHALPIFVSSLAVAACLAYSQRGILERSETNNPLICPIPNAPINNVSSFF